jgi:hypothetical protein
MDSPTPSISLRLLGTIEAGFPSPAEEELSDTLNKSVKTEAKLLVIARG